MRNGMGMGMGAGGAGRVSASVAAKLANDTPIEPIISGSYKYFVFPSSGSLIVNSETEVDYIAVGCGGAGGGGVASAPQGGGGGGGGEVVSGTVILTPAQYIMIVGAMPTAPVSYVAGDDGSPTIFCEGDANEVTALGGAGGATHTDNGIGQPQSGTAFASGGGASHMLNFTINPGGIANSPHGNAGGKNGNNGVDVTTRSGGGGGGFMGAGADAAPNLGGAGGIGKALSDIWAGVVNTVLGVPVAFGAGGGGGTRGGTPGVGGSLVGGNGSKAGGVINSAVENSGSGGGGCGYEGTAPYAGKGGNGIIIVRVTI